MATKTRKSKRASRTSVKRTASKTKVAKKKTAPTYTAKKSKPGKAGPVNQWMELRRSPIHGLGAFARREIPKGTKIIEYVGEKISNAEADRRYDDETMANHHTFLFILNSKQCIDAAFEGNESRFINHSCDPNCEAFIPRGRIWIESIKDIPKGAELAYDYAFEDDKKYTREDYLDKYGCRCGSANCRGTIVETKKKLK